MKKTTLFTGIILILINTTIGLIFESYKPFNMIMADFSIILSTAIIYIAYSSKIADGFKIGFTVAFALTGLIRFICAIVSSENIKNNFAIVSFIILLSIEFLFLIIGNSLKNK